MVVFFGILALGTFLFFPRLAKALVGLGLVGCLVIAGLVGYQIWDRQLQEERDRRDAAACGELFRESAQRPPDGPVDPDYLLRVFFGGVDGSPNLANCQRLFGEHGERLVSQSVSGDRLDVLSKRYFPQVPPRVSETLPSPDGKALYEQLMGSSAPAPPAAPVRQTPPRELEELSQRYFPQARSAAAEPTVEELHRAVYGDRPPGPCQTGRELVLDIYGTLPNPAPSWVWFALAHESDCICSHDTGHMWEASSPHLLQNL